MPITSLEKINVKNYFILEHITKHPHKNQSSLFFSNA